MPSYHVRLPSCFAHVSVPGRDDCTRRSSEAIKGIVTDMFFPRVKHPSHRGMTCLRCPRSFAHALILSRRGDNVHGRDVALLEDECIVHVRELLPTELMLFIGNHWYDRLARKRQSQGLIVFEEDPKLHPSR